MMIYIRWVSKTGYEKLRKEQNACNYLMMIEPRNFYTTVYLSVQLGFFLLLLKCFINITVGNYNLIRHHKMGNGHLSLN